MEKAFWDRFLDFEKENHLFDLQDEYGTYYWDILRYEIYPLLLWEGGFLSSSSQKRTIKDIITKAFSIFYEPFRLFFLCPKKENLFYLASRNKIDGNFIDQNAKAVYDLFSKQENLVIESFNSHSHLKNSYFLPQRIFRRLLKKGKTTDFSFLMNILEKEFGKLSFNEEFLQKKISNYYADVTFFSHFLRRKNIKRLFFMQNGVQKGMIRAAKSLNVSIFEFHHGIVDEGHLLYNYPKIDYKEGQITLPDTILSLSPFWFNELYLPNVKIASIGNDYFYSPLAEITSTTDSSIPESILVISSDVFGKDLSDFILRLEKEGQVKNIPIYFKLHPNQFFEKEYYIEKLRSINNLRIITNEQSVGELLKICNTVFAIQSTAIYEALQANRKVILLKKMSYLRHKHIFDRKNLHLVDTTEDFISALNTKIVIDQNVAFFAPFDKEAFFEAL